MHHSPCLDSVLPGIGFQGHFGGYERDLALVHGGGVFIFKTIPGWFLAQIPKKVGEMREGF